MSKIDCSYFPNCGGCQWIGEDLETQKNRKISALENILHEKMKISIPIDWLSAGPGFLRDRLDFIWERGRFGLKDKNHQQVIDIQECAQLSPALQSWYNDFRKIKWPIERGSIRLRVGPQGLRGAWLDFANLDIKNLLSEKSELQQALALGFVELGQKRKGLVSEGGYLKLRDPVPQFWFESLYKSKPLPIYSHVGSFTQPSLRANRLILKNIEDFLATNPSLRASEFGCGIGNLSLTLLGAVSTLRVFENDTLSLQCFKKTLDHYPELQARIKDIEIFAGDFQKSKSLNFHSDELLLLNPPRSGLKGFLQSLRQSPELPKDIVYLSCSPETWGLDGAELTQLGYKLDRVFIVDQFPQTRHFEVLSYWSSSPA